MVVRAAPSPSLSPVWACSSQVPPCMVSVCHVPLRHRPWFPSGGGPEREGSSSLSFPFAPDWLPGKVRQGQLGTSGGGASLPLTEVWGHSFCSQEDKASSDGGAERREVALHAACTAELPALQLPADRLQDFLLLSSLCVFLLDTIKAS